MAGQGLQAGRNYGVAGTIDFIPGSGSASAHLINFEVLGFAEALAAEKVNITGPGSNYVQRWYTANVGGTGSASGEVQNSQAPFPPTMHNLQGTITLTYNDNCTIVLPVTFTTINTKKNAKTENLWEVSAEWEKNGQEVVTWNGSTPSYTQPGYTVSQLFFETVKTTDPNHLTTNYTVKYFLPVAPVAGVSYSDTAINASVDAFLATVPVPRADQKIVDAAFMPLDDSSGLMILHWGTKNSDDEQTLPRESFSVDPNDITSADSYATVWDTTGSPPSQPSTPSGTKFIKYTDYPVTTRYSVRVWEFGTRDSSDDVVLPHVGNKTDPNVITSTVSLAALFTNGSPPSQPSNPSGLKFIDSTDISITPSLSVRVWNYGTNDSIDELVRSLRHGTYIVVDPNGIDSNARIAAVSATQPATPTNNPAGTTLLTVTQHPITDVLSFWIFTFGTLDSIGELELTSARIDDAPVPLDSTASVPVVNGSPPSSSAYTGLKLIETDYREVNGSVNLETGRYSYRNSNDVIQFDGGRMSLSPFANDNSESIVQVVACLATDVLETIAQAKYLTVVNTTSPVQGVPFRQLLARRFHATAVIYTTQYQGYNYVPPQNPGVKSQVHGNFGLIQNASYICVVGVGSNPVVPTPVLYIQDVITRGSGNYLVQLGVNYYNSVGGPFIVEQQFTGSSVSLGASSIGLTNDANFLGYALGTVMYLGCDYDVIISATSTTFNMRYKFNYNSAGFITTRGIPSDGRVYTTTSPSLGNFAGSLSGLVYTFTLGTTVITATISDQDAFAFASFSQT